VTAFHHVDEMPRIRSVADRRNLRRRRQCACDNFLRGWPRRNQYRSNWPCHSSEICLSTILICKRHGAAPCHADRAKHPGHAGFGLTPRGIPRKST
jgi:hypothetical protein